MKVTGVIAFACAVAWCWTGRGQAQLRLPEEEISHSRLRVRASVGGGVLVSSDQTGFLGFDGFGLLVDGSLGYRVLPWLEPQLSLLGGFFPASQGGAGGLLSPLAGVSVGTLDPETRLHALVEVGPGFTGGLIRPFVRAGIGLDFRVTAPLTMGPILGYGQVLQTNGPLDSTDARFVFLVLSTTFRAATIQKPKPEVRVVHDVRTEREVVRLREPAPTPEPSAELMALLDRAVPAARVELLAPVLFQFDRDRLRPVGVAMLHEVARELDRRRDIKVLEIQGYADSRGDAAHNLDLSKRRAERVRQWLIEHGVAPERLVVAPHGAADFVEQDATGEPQHQQNRRVVFRVIEMAEKP